MVELTAVTACRLSPYACRHPAAGGERRRATTRRCSPGAFRPYGGAEGGRCRGHRSVCLLVGAAIEGLRAEPASIGCRRRKGLPHRVGPPVGVAELRKVITRGEEDLRDFQTEEE